MNPKYTTLAALMQAVKDGVEDPATFHVTVDNDSIYAYYNDDRDDGCLYSSGASLSDLVVEYLRSMGLPAGHA